MTEAYAGQLNGSSKGNMSVLIFVVFLFSPVFILGLDDIKACTTPNGEEATCIPLSTCKLLHEAVLTLDPTAIAFVRESSCGYDKGPLVCCGATTVRSYGSEPFQNRLLPNKTVCGYQIAEDRIWGGEETEIGEFPWMCLIGYKNTVSQVSEGYKCGGSLISSRYVLTAAHCVKLKKVSELEIDHVRLGEWRISTEKDCLNSGTAIEDCADPVIDLKLEKAIPHPGYNAKTGNNDIGLIRLEKNVKYTNYIRPICLPPANTPKLDEITKLIACGWGSTESASRSDVKLKLTVRMVSSDKCREKIGERGFVGEGQLCAGGVRGEDACAGDSGGALMTTFPISNEKREQWYQVAVISWGVGCANSVPGVYTRVSAYLKWIVQNMSEF